jgi:branched-chain amino acid transport system substrate-binding protein
MALSKEFTIANSRTVCAAQSSTWLSRRRVKVAKAGPAVTRRGSSNMNARTLLPPRRVAAVLIAALLALIPMGGNGASNQPYEIYAFAALTGSFAFIGSEEAKSMSAIEQIVNKNGGINGRPIKFVIEDDQSNPQVSAQLMSQAIAANAALVFGGGIVSTCNAAAALVRDKGPVLYCLSAGVHPPAGSFIYSSGFSSSDQILVAVRYFRDRGIRNIALITTTDATGQDADRTIDSIFALPENRSEKVVAREHFAITDLSVAAQSSRIRASGAEAVIAWVTGNPLGTVLHGFRDTGLDLPTVATAGNASYPVMRAFSSVLPSQMLFPGLFSLAPESAPNPSIAKAIAQFQDQFKNLETRPDGGYAITWDAAFISIAALQKYGDTTTAPQIRDYINGVRGWNGIIGRFDYSAYPQRGLGPESIPMLRWNATSSSFEPVSKAASNLPKQ